MLLASRSLRASCQVPVLFVGLVSGMGVASVVGIASNPSLGTGVGAAIIVNGQLYRGEHNSAGEIGLLLAHAPDAFDLLDLAKEYGADRDRFEKEASFCIHCGLCLRYCAEDKKKNAVGFVDRGTRREISFVPEIASKECWNCKECFPLCPTSYLQAAYLLTEALAFPPRTSNPPQGNRQPLILLADGC